MTIYIEKYSHASGCMAETWQKWSLSMGAVSQPGTRIRRESRWQKQQKRSA